MRQTDIQARLYKAVLLVGAALSVFSVIGNYLSGFPFLTDVKWIALFAITVFAFFFSNSERAEKAVRFCVFVFLICIFLPFAFIDSGGSSNNAMGYTFLLLIVTTYLFGGWQRISLIAALIIMFAAMHALEYYRPDFIRAYSAQSQFLDRLIQIPLLLLASFVIILRFANEYERVNKKLNVLAKYDELTGLKNRREFDKAVDDAFRGEKGVAQLAFLDLNNFKKLNDRCGHSAGDQALKVLAALLQKAFDPTRNVVSRWGGDEFAVVYYGEKREISEKMAWIEAEFGDYVCAFEETAGISTSIVSFCDYQSIDQMFLDADRQLYEQKKGLKAGGCAL